jgi:anaerobic selenocysteine-containing dehydrogenase
VPWQDGEELTRWLLEPTGLTLEQLAGHPEGYPYRSVRYEKWREQPLATPSGKVEFTSQYLKDLGYPEMEMHPADAARLGLADGERARVSSRVGAIEIPVTVTAPNEILPGTVQITHGYRQANVNLLTPDDVFDPISGFPLMKALQVKVERAGSAVTPPDRTP